MLYTEVRIAKQASIDVITRWHELATIDLLAYLARRIPAQRKKKIPHVCMQM
jgi:hypothetical protein